jgi:hypothetical protein
MNTIKVDSYFKAIFLFLILGFVFTSCKKDGPDKGLKITKENIQGVWINKAKDLELDVRSVGAVYVSRKEDILMLSSWSIGNTGSLGDYLELKTSTRCVKFRLKTNTTLQNIDNNDILTKQ